MRITNLFLIMALSVMLLSCTDKYYDIPSNYKGVILTPNGFSNKVYQPGMINLGQLDNESRGNKLILVENTAITMKESFAKVGENEDHRVRPQDGTPLTTDLYVQISMPDDDQSILNAVKSVTPDAINGEDRVSVISLSKIYTQYVQMTIRGKFREIISNYDKSETILKNVSKVNAETGLAAAEVFKKSKAPCQLMLVQISNVQEDRLIVDSKNKVKEAQNEADAINKISEALKNNPKYLELKKYETYKYIADRNKGTISFNIFDGQTPPIVVGK